MTQNERIARMELVCKEAAHALAGREWSGLSVQEKNIVVELYQLGMLVRPEPANGHVGRVAA